MALRSCPVSLAICLPVLPSSICDLMFSCSICGKRLAPAHLDLFGPSWPLCGNAGPFSASSLFCCPVPLRFCLAHGLKQLFQQASAIPSFLSWSAAASNVAPTYYEEECNPLPNRFLQDEGRGVTRCSPRPFTDGYIAPRASSSRSTAPRFDANTNRKTRELSRVALLLLRYAFDSEFRTTSTEHGA